MPESPAKSTLIVDLINITFGALAWMFPDISLISKIQISLVLLTIVILARTSFKFSLIPSGFRYAILILLSMAVTCVEFFGAWWLAKIAVPSFWFSIYQLLISTFVYSLLVGVPLVLGGFISKVASTIGIASGCTLQVIAFFATLFLVDVTIYNHWLSDAGFLGICGPAGFMLTLTSGDDLGLGTALMFLMTIGFICFQNYQFLGLGAWLRTLWK